MKNQKQDPPPPSKVSPNITAGTKEGKEGEPFPEPKNQGDDTMERKAGLGHDAFAKWCRYRGKDGRIHMRFPLGP